MERKIDAVARRKNALDVDPVVSYSVRDAGVDRIVYANPICRRRSVMSGTGPIYAMEECVCTAKQRRIPRNMYIIN